MTLLLDTHALLWFAGADPRLSRAARRAMDAEDSELVISAATVWEMAIKSGTGDLQLHRSVDEYVLEKLAEGYTMWPITWEHAAGVAVLPWHHRDPFDRLLVAQALSEKCAVVTADRMFRKYGVDVVW